MTTEMARALIDALQAAGQVGAGGRLNHARGIVLDGRFRATRRAAALCRAAVFSGNEQRVVARFSSAGADPEIDQRSPQAEPRGLALHIGNQAPMVLVGHAIEGFPATDPARFLAVLKALEVATRSGVAPRVDVVRCPAWAGFEDMRQHQATSFSGLDYHLLHPYRLVGNGGQVRVGRLGVRATRHWHGGEAFEGPDCLDRRLCAELRQGPVVFALHFTPVPEGVDASDLSVAWDPALPSLVLGHVWLERQAAEQDARRQWVFDPGMLPPGMEFAGDPMIQARLLAYRLAAQRRLGAERTAAYRPG